jgi:hypothetical protein
MAMVTLEIVKNALGIVGDYQDDTLQVYFDEVIDMNEMTGGMHDVCKEEACQKEGL